MTMSLKAVRQRGREFLQYYKYQRWDQKLARYGVMYSVSMISKFLTNKFFDTKVENIDRFTEIYDTAQVESRGILTYMNHTSILDDPLVWGVLPYGQYKPSKMRWSLGADNICFRSAFRSRFFSLGKVLATKRFGAGPFQGSVDGAIELLSQNSDQYLTRHPRIVRDGSRVPAQWVHVFPESFVHQPLPPHEETLRYFHWGVSRIILESTKPPIIMPIFISGLQHILPEDHSKIKGLFKLYKSPISVSFAKPLDDAVIADFRQRWSDLLADSKQTEDFNYDLSVGPEAQRLRSEVATYLRNSMEVFRQELGRGPEDPRLGDADFWRLSEEERGLSVMKNQHKKNPDIID